MATQISSPKVTAALMIDAASRYEGAMLSPAIDGALGWPVDFMSLDATCAQYGSDGITNLEPNHSHPAGTYTDDTQMSLAIAQPIMSKGHEPEDVGR